MRILRSLLPLLGLAFLVASGCASSKPAAVPADAGTLFSQGKYAAAYAAASQDANAKRGTPHDKSALIAGLSAYHLGKPGDAHRWLIPLADNSNPVIAGRANATLGSLAASQGTNGSAADYFTKAATRLTGDDAARALMYAGDARRAQGRHADATTLYEQSRERVQADAQLRLAVGDRLAGRSSPVARGGSGTGSSTTAYTVQAGLFSRRSAADQLLRSLPVRDQARVVSTRDSAGRDLFAVRVGRFSSKSQADTVRKRLGAGAFVMASE